MAQIWANYLLQQTGMCVVPSSGWVNVGDVLKRRGSGATSTVLAVIPDPSGCGPADPIQEPNPADCVTLDQPAVTIGSGELVNWIWLS